MKQIIRYVRDILMLFSCFRKFLQIRSEHRIQSAIGTLDEFVIYYVHAKNGKLIRVEMKEAMRAFSAEDLSQQIFLQSFSNKLRN